DHVLVKTNLDEIVKAVPAPEKRQLVVYKVTPAQRTRFQSLQPSLVTDLPDIRVVADGEPEELSIWAKPSQHEVLKTLLEELKREVPAAEKPMLRVYGLKCADATTAMTVLKSLFPAAKVSLDAPNRNFVVIA